MGIMKTNATKFYHWANAKASSSKAPLWLGLLFFLELVLLVPLDAIMIFFCLQKRNHIFLYVMIATIASTLSAVGGYLLGHFLWDLIGNWVVPHLIPLATFEQISHHLEAYENWAVFLCALFPLPLKALSLISGVFHLSFFPFVTCLTTARLIRFGLIGTVMAIWGEKLKLFLDRHFHRVFLLLGAKIALATGAFWVLAR